MTNAAKTNPKDAESEDRSAPEAENSDGVTNALAELIAQLREQDGPTEENNPTASGAVNQLAALVSTVIQSVDELKSTLAEAESLRDEIATAVKESRAGIGQWNAGSAQTQTPTDAGETKPANSASETPTVVLSELQSEMPSVWESQKAALLQTYGEPTEAKSGGKKPDPQTVPDQSGLTPVDPAAPASDSAKTESPEVEKCDQAGEPTDPVIEPGDVAELKRVWEDKLRNAEIEISIERAKIARMESELDLKLTEVDQKLKASNRHQAESKGRGKDKSKLMRRLSRLLPQSEDDHGDDGAEE